MKALSAITEPFVRMKMTTAVKPVEFNGQQEADSDESMDYRQSARPDAFQQLSPTAEHCNLNRIAGTAETHGAGDDMAGAHLVHFASCA